MASNPVYVRLSVLAKLQEALDEEDILADQILTMMHCYADRFTNRRVEINNLMVLQDHPLMDYDIFKLADNEQIRNPSYIVKKHEEQAFPTAADDAKSSTSYQPPPDATMGPTVYPPARQNPQQGYKLDYQFGYPQGKGNTFYGGYGEYHNSQWTLPPAWTESGVMLAYQQIQAYGHTWQCCS
nr:hypothetical protein [Tanacetum cinerariifolium]